MNAVRFHEHGGPEVLSVEETDRPNCGHGEVLIEVKAAGVNPVDTYYRAGAYDPVQLPFTPGVDIAGLVTAVGPGVSDFTEGDRVFGTGIGNANHQGAYADFAVAPESRIAHLPEGVEFIQAGAAGVVSFTAWRALIQHANLRATETCLIHGGNGGVGHAAVQIAAAAGAHVLTTADPQYHDRLKTLGADAVVDYRRDDLAEVITDLSDGGVDVILDHRLDEYLQFDADVAAIGCRVVGIGESDPEVRLTDDGVARSKDVSYQFMSMFNAPNFKEPLTAIASLLADGDLTIATAQTFELAEAAAAQRSVMEESFFGKIVIVP